MPSPRSSSSSFWTIACNLLTKNLLVSACIYRAVEFETSISITDDGGTLENMKAHIQKQDKSFVYLVKSGDQASIHEIFSWLRIFNMNVVSVFLHRSDTWLFAILLWPNSKASPTAASAGY